MTKEMEFCLLGPLLIRSRGGAVPIQRGRQRAVLATLLLSANRLVPTDELAETLWGDSPPPAAGATIRNHIKRLRQALGDDDKSRISTQPHGYMISIAVGELDIAKFETLLTAARQAAQGHIWDVAADQARTALTLWRGEPLSDVEPRTLADGAAPRLTELRLQALEVRIDADLHLGRQAEVVLELQQLAGAHPLRENLHRLLMSALVRCGRQAEALAAYQRARRVLVDELGIEPGFELRELHAQILAGDPGPTGAAAGHAPTAAIAVAPRQLPAAARYFTGRQAELDTLTALTQAPDQAAGSGGTVVISAIDGMAGIGKTALAVHWAHGHADWFPDGQLYVNLRGFDPSGTPVDTATAARGFLDALVVPPARIPVELDAQLALYRSRLADTRTLIVVDNARDENQVRALLPGSAGCMVLVTSRNRLPGLVGVDRGKTGGGGETDVRAGMQAQQAEHAGGAGAERGVGPREHRARHQSGDPARRPGAGAPRHTPQTGPAVCWRKRRRHARGVLVVLPHAQHPRRPRVPPAGPASRPEHRSHRHRQSCRDRPRPGPYAAEQARAYDTDDDQHDALHRMLDYHLHTTRTAYALMHPNLLPLDLDDPRSGVTLEPLADRDQALNWYRAEHPGLRATVAAALDAGFDSHAWRIAWGWAMFLDRGGQWQDLAAISEIALAATERAKDQAGQAFAHRAWGNAAGALGSYLEAHAHLRQASALYAALGNGVHQGMTNHSMAMLSERERRFTDALDQEHQALNLFRAADFSMGQVMALNGICWYNTLLGWHDRALTYGAQALDLARQIGSVDREAAILDSLGYVHHHLGQHAEAITYYRRAHHLFQRAGDLYDQGETLIHLGDTYHATGDSTAAREAWQQALAILDDLQHPDADQVRTKI